MAVHHLSSKPLQKTLPKWICPAFPSKSDLGKHSLFKNFLDLNQVFIPRTILLCLVCNQIILWKIIESDTNMFISFDCKQTKWKSGIKQNAKSIPLKRPPPEMSQETLPLQIPPPETSSKDVRRDPLQRPPPETPSRDPLQKPPPETPPETPCRDLRQTHLAIDKVYWKFKSWILIW